MSFFDIFAVGVVFAGHVVQISSTPWTMYLSEEFTKSSMQTRV